jgi:hypothetical protein
LNGTCPNNTPNRDWSTEVGLATFIGANQTRIDTTPPQITISVTPNVLWPWPPNDRMVSVTVSGAMTEDEPDGTGIDAGTATYAVTDSYGEVQPHGRVTLGLDGSYTFTTQLQASLARNDEHGRRYTILVNALDNSGNKGVGFALVTVGSRGH